MSTPSFPFACSDRDDLRPVRRIAHLDMDAFFASVELLRFPQLVGHPVVIGGGQKTLAEWIEDLNTRFPNYLGRPWGMDGNDGAMDLQQVPLQAFARLSAYRGRGVVTTATYEARAWGVGSAMGLMQAARRCPQAFLLPSDFDRYRDYSRRFKAEILRLAPVMENRGIDEVYIDFTEAPGGQDEGGVALARRIQQAIRDATGLTCSIGIAPNKLLAKMASEFNKPNGIAVLYEDELTERIWPLACSKINGLGPKTAAALARHGIETIGQLAQCDVSWLVQRFGPRQGRWLHRSAWGIDPRPLVTESKPVSLSRERTFSRDLHAVDDRDELGRILTGLCERVADDLIRRGLAGGCVGIKLRYDDFRVVTRDQRLSDLTRDVTAIRRAAGLCLKRVDLSRRLRLLGIRVSSLQRWPDTGAAQSGRGESLPLF